MLGFLFPSPKLPVPPALLASLRPEVWGQGLHPAGGLVCVTWQLISMT